MSLGTILISESTPSCGAPHEVVSGRGDQMAVEWSRAEQEDGGLSLIKRPPVRAPFPDPWLSLSVIPQDLYLNSDQYFAIWLPGLGRGGPQHLTA